MAIEKISENQLREMADKEGLILQGCGGEIREWLDGINDILTQNGILRNGSKFENCRYFKSEGVTCILFPFENVDLDINRLAVWRIRTHSAFCGRWLSDYVDNRLGGFEQKKPKCRLVGENGNIFNVMAIASNALKGAGMNDAAKEMCDKVMQSGSYDETLGIVLEYVDDSSDEEESEENGMNLQ